MQNITRKVIEESDNLSVSNKFLSNQMLVEISLYTCLAFSTTLDKTWPYKI